MVQSVRNANDAISLTQVAALIIEISRIGSDTSFAGVPLLSGDYSSTLQIGAFAGQTLSVNFSRQGGFGASGIAVGSIDVTTLYQIKFIMSYNICYRSSTNDQKWDAYLS